MIPDQEAQLGPRIDATPAPRPQRVTLTGRFVTFAPLASTHATSLFELSGGPANAGLWTYLFNGPFDDPQAFAADVEAKAKAEDPLYFAVIDNKTGRAIGYQSLMRIDPIHHVVEVGGILYTPALQGTAGSTEAQYLFAKYVFDTLGYRRYEWKCDSLNGPSRAAAERYGFRFEGLFRQAVIYKGRNRDTAWFSIIDEEWPAVRTAFEAWLDPGNFDEAGLQRRSLAAIRAALCEGDRKQD